MNDVSQAMGTALAAGSGRALCLQRLMDAPWNVGLLRLRGQHAEADAMGREAPPARAPLAGRGDRRCLTAGCVEEYGPGDGLPGDP